ncbi:MAG: prephenate dehydrogenase/arogenate dehydrogenase family protein [Syntrophales bacterium]|jgi:prephenate dehydrogenase|nr:prephenate dehydrogenase/arogenate dehydrogenase family protein [Syntrophales bacterium]
MTDYKVAELGGGKGMGAWCVKFLSEQGCTVHAVEKGEEIKKAVSGCHVVVIAVPIHVTREVIELAGPLLGPDDLLMDLTSLKEEPVKWMCESTRAEVIGCHPLFGPSVDTVKGLNVVLCPVRAPHWIEWLRELFVCAGAHVIETTPHRHDRIMSVIQGLNHLNTMTMYAALQKTGIAPDELKDFTTPLFLLKQSIIDKTVGDQAKLHAEIILKNPHMREMLALYEKSLSEIKDLISRGDVEKFAEYLGEGNQNE